MRSSGQPVRLAERDGRIARSLSTPLTADWLAGRTTASPTTPGTRRWPRVLDAHGAVGALLIDGSDGDFEGPRRGVDCSDADPLGSDETPL